MTLAEAIVKAVKERNATLAGRISDHLRYRRGMNYEESLAFVRNVCSKIDVSVDGPEWDALLYQADYEASS